MSGGEVGRQGCIVAPQEGYARSESKGEFFAFADEGRAVIYFRRGFAIQRRAQINGAPNMPQSAGTLAPTPVHRYPDAGIHGFAIGGGDAGVVVVGEIIKLHIAPRQLRLGCDGEGAHRHGIADFGGEGDAAAVIAIHPGFAGGGEVAGEGGELRLGVHIEACWCLPVGGGGEGMAIGFYSACVFALGADVALGAGEPDIAAEDETGDSADGGIHAEVQAGVANFVFGAGFAGGVGFDFADGGFGARPDAAPLFCCPDAVAEAGAHSRHPRKFRQGGDIIFVEDVGGGEGDREGGQVAVGVDIECAVATGAGDGAIAPVCRAESETGCA